MVAEILSRLYLLTESMFPYCLGVFQVKLAEAGLYQWFYNSKSASGDHTHTFFLPNFHLVVFIELIEVLSESWQVARQAKGAIQPSTSQQSDSVSLYVSVRQTTTLLFTVVYVSNQVTCIRGTKLQLEILNYFSVICECLPSKILWRCPLRLPACFQYKAT